MLASISGYVSVCKCLIEHGCDIEARTKKTYETALTLAYKSDKKEIVTLLAQAKAHMEQQNERASDPSDMDDDLYEYNEDYDSNQDRTCQPSGIIHENSNVQNTSHQEFAFAQLHKMLQKFWLFVELYGTSNNDKDLNRHVYFMMLMLIIVVLGPVCLVQISLDKGELSIKEVQINQKDFQIQNLTQRLNHSSIKIKLLNKQLVSLEENRKLDATYMSRLIFGLANCIKSSRCNNSAVRQKNWIWMMNSNHDEVTEIYESKDFYTNSLNIFTNYTQPEFLVVEMLQPAFNESIIRELEKEDRISLAKIKFENHWGSIKDYFNCQWFMDTLKNENKTKPLKWKSEQDKTFNQEANKTRPSKWSSTEEKAKLLKDTQTSEFRKKA
uniref:Uncharacterized protein n=1 Tax=Acrobeloides nanus TaxID=290746 RepID=A0A914BY66_9BILA